MHCSCPHASSHHRCSPQSATRGLHSYPQITLGLFLGHAPSFLRVQVPRANSEKVSKVPRYFTDRLRVSSDVDERTKSSARRLLDGAVAWLLAQGPDIVPIPGTKRVTYLESNAAAADLVLTPADLAELGSAFPPGAAAGARYAPDMMRWL